MATVFWDSHAVILIDYLQKGKTITGACYASLLDKLKVELAEKRPHLQKKKILFHPGNAPHTSAVPWKFRAAVVTAQGAKCRNIAIVELQIRIREFLKAWQFHILADLEYPYILGVDCIRELKIVLDFDRKSLTIPEIIPSIDEGNLEIDLTNTGLDEGQKQELQSLFNSFKGLFSDKPGLTHVLYQEIDTGNKPRVVSRPYRYDRVK
ncbi:histone-lysine N-methyltransferase SETMAR [Trichonephila clavipes]|nr:histone-lysine N-methyltransferase SETMAR [Trichonephila clavipes]